MMHRAISRQLPRLKDWWLLLLAYLDIDVLMFYDFSYDIKFHYIIDAGQHL